MERRRLFFLISFFSFALCQAELDRVANDLMITREDILEPPNFVYWPNGTVPFYINQEHFDYEQTLTIMTSLSLIAFKTCLKFAPTMVAPNENQHVLAFVNPTGAHKCAIDMRGHSKTEPHLVTLGYDCLKAPWMDRIVLRALGLPFEHNRQVRDTYIDVQYENIEQHAIPLYTRDIALPAALRALPYDVHSVMHFGERDFSKNGHRTIIFKDRETKQKWDGLTELDLRKIEIIYGPECRERDRQEKIELCHMYPGIPPVDRRKRSLDVETSKSLRVNPDITPPADNGLNISKEVQATLIKLNIEAELSKIVEDVFRVSSKALSHTRAQFCNVTKESLRTSQTEGKTDVLGIIEMVADYAQTMVDTASKNLTSFCAESDSIDKYQRFRCADGCEKQFYSTKHSYPFHSTRNKPYIAQYTRHVGGPVKPPYDRQYSFLRARNDSLENSKDTASTKSQRKKRQVEYMRTRYVVELERSKRGANTEGPSREGRRKQSERVKKHRARYSPENERFESNGEERVKRKTKQPLSEESETKNRNSAMNKRNRLKNKRGVKRNRKRPVVDSEDADSTKVKPISLESDERENEKPKRPAKKDSEEKGKDVVDEEEQQSDEGGAPAKKQPKHGLEEKIQQFEESDDEPKNAVLNPKTLVLSKANQEFYKQRRWPHGFVPYVIVTNSTKFDIRDLRRRLALVNGILRRRTCTRIQEIRPQDVNKHEDYLVLDNSPDFVTGRVGGRQVFGVPELLAGGQHRQHTAMVVMAMLGFYFELSRHDRDEYVKVHQRHIRADKLHHFEKIGPDATFPMPYDYESATHPAWMFWRKLGKTGISTVATYKDKDPDGSIMKSLGQHKKLLSEGDIIKINSVYGVKCMQKHDEKIESQINNPKSDWET